MPSIAPQTQCCPRYISWISACLCLGPMPFIHACFVCPVPVCCASAAELRPCFPTPCTTPFFVCVPTVYSLYSLPPAACIFITVGRAFARFVSPLVWFCRSLEEPPPCRRTSIRLRRYLFQTASYLEVACFPPFVSQLSRLRQKGALIVTKLAFAGLPIRTYHRECSSMPA
jgi:hypothetical protein